ncbi:MAG: DsrE family protein, partial [Proteobacteria bacterium]|nr:DsrE family protein [Pseudomonadota bacterium]
DVRIFLFADGVRMVEAKAETTFDITELSAGFAERNTPVAACISCLDKRGLTDAVLPTNAQRATLKEAVEWTSWADKVLVY